MNVYIQIAILVLAGLILLKTFQFISDLWNKGLLLENTVLIVFVVAICYVIVRQLINKL